MDSINPNDIYKLDKGTISCITLKDGKMVMVDESAPEKYSSNESKSNKSNYLYEHKKSKLAISKKITYSYDSENKDILDFRKINLRYNEPISSKRMIKNDFNLISHISKNTNFALVPNPGFNTRNIKLTEKIKKDENNPFNNKDNEENIFSSNKNIFNKSNSSKEEIPEKEKRTKRRSRNLSESRNSLFEEKFIGKTHSVINFNLIADLNKHLTETQKKFNNLLTQLKKKKFKYSLNPKDKINYHRYYELYKNGEGEIRKYVHKNFKGIKYYQKPEKDTIEIDKDSQDIYNKYNISKKNQNFSDNIITNTKNIIHRNCNPKFDMDYSNTIDRSSINSYNDIRTRASSEKKIINSKLGHSIGYSSTLICPSNLFKIKLV